MKLFKLTPQILITFLLLSGGIFFSFKETYAAFNVQSVKLTRDNNICTLNASGETTALNLSNIQSSSESVQSHTTSGGSLCSTPPFFIGGALQTTSNGIKMQAIPTIQSLGRGILISETAGATGGITSSGDPTGFSTLISYLGGLSTSIFEISLPSECDVVDDDDDIVGASSDLSLINDFSFPTCSSTNGLTVVCNAASGLLTAANGLVAATSSTPAKVRFVISDLTTSTDGAMIDSILIKFDSQDIFCPATAKGPLTATVTAKNAVDSPTKTQTIGTADLGTPTQAAKISYVISTATSTKGEISTNEVSDTPVLLNGSTATANTIQIEELDNESIPISGQSSPILINPTATSTADINTASLWLIPSSSTLFSAAPQTSDITFSDNSISISSAPYIVMSSSDDLNAPFGTLVIPLKKNSDSTDPTTVKTIIKINNLILSSPGLSSQESPTVSLSIFEPVSGAIVNVPGGLAVNDSTNPTNPQNFSAFSVGSTRALAQNAVIGGAVNEATAAAQITTDADLLALATKDTALGAPRISGFTQIFSSSTSADTSKITVSNSNSVLTVTGSAGATLGGAKLKVDSLASGQTTVYDSVTITSKSDGSFTAKLQADFSKGDVTLNFKQTVSGSDSQVTSKTVPKQSSTTTGLSCDKTVCGCENTSCTPTVSSIQSYITGNGGLASIVTTGGDILQELISSAKKALGLS